MKKVSDELLKILACPICKNDLNLFEQKFICSKNKKHEFGFTKRFPNFIVE